MSLKRRNSSLVRGYLEQVRDLGEEELYLTSPDCFVASFPVSVEGTGADTGEDSLASLAERIEHCKLCRLAESRRKAVPGAGNPAAGLVMVGEAPGEQEDRQGVPFIGPSGRLLRRLFRLAGLDETSYFLTNILKCRPPRNRDPLPEEVAACTPFLEEQLRILKPKLLVALGRHAGRHLLGKEGLSLRSMRGKVHSYGGVPVVVTYHPSAMLHGTGCRPDAWADIRRISHMILDPGIGPLGGGKCPESQI